MDQILQTVKNFAFGYDAAICAKCEERPYDVNCSCHAKFCEGCFEIHHRRQPSHFRGGTRRTESFWERIIGKGLDPTSRVEWEKDEAAKWFGLHIPDEIRQTNDLATGECRIIVTQRMNDLMESSVSFNENSPARQYPSIISFIGDSGVGKSTLVRALIYQEARTGMENPDAPIPGNGDGPSNVLSVSGEVNLYADPVTFGGESPRLYADCEGLLGAQPLGSKHQSEWTKHGTSYSINQSRNEPVDRKYAVQEIYPRLLYIFSDMVCYVMRNQKTWADSALKLLNWSMVGAESTINQYALPALIIVLNGPSMENIEWVVGSEDIITENFFAVIEPQLQKDESLKKLARRRGVSTVRDLFRRSFSSVHVHYIPLAGYNRLGSTDIVLQQHAKLADRINRDSAHVQDLKMTAWTRFDVQQFQVVMGWAFQHLTEDTTKPFDLSKCRQELTIPKSLDQNFTEFLLHSLKGEPEVKKEQLTAAVLGTSIVLNTYRGESHEFIYLDIVFSPEMEVVCQKAVDAFLVYMTCKYTDQESGRKCVNTKQGHALGHQNSHGQLMAQGDFEAGSFEDGKFIEMIRKSASEAIEVIKNADHKRKLDRTSSRRLAVKCHQDRLEKLRNAGVFPQWNRKESPFFYGKMKNDFERQKICFGCLYGRIEYALPCGHRICHQCLEDFDTTQPKYPCNFTLLECFLCKCSASNSKYDWPFRIHARPPLAGLRVLSLDGGGVRGIIELSLLKRLEEKIHLDLPIADFFDLIIGTSAGGMIALGLGIQRRRTSGCLSLFQDICDNGFHVRFMANTPGVGHVVRFFYTSMYKTEKYQEAIQKAFESGIEENRVQTVFGLQSSTRVAVTTTVMENGTKLITNYDPGYSTDYMQSEIPLWMAARCTSAAPMYFEPVSHAGYQCFDGGLNANNPVDFGISEGKKIWGDDVSFDLVISVGSGRAKQPPKVVEVSKQKKHWTNALYRTFIGHLNGETAWSDYQRRHSGSQVKNRSFRLNAVLSDEREPGLADTEKIEDMEKAAMNFNFSFKQDQDRGWFPADPGLRDSGYSKTKYGDDYILYLADQIRSAMFFFDLQQLEGPENNGIFSVRGRICCRIHSDNPALDVLIQMISHFTCQGDQTQTLQPSVNRGFASKPFELPLSFKFNSSNKSRIQIEACFGGTRSVPISGFPMNFETLKDHWKTIKDYVGT